MNRPSTRVAEVVRCFQFAQEDAWADFDDDFDEDFEQETAEELADLEHGHPMPHNPSDDHWNDISQWEDA